jgi:hypothetical protein
VCDSCLRFLAGRCAAAPGFRATCIRRAESSGGLLATSFGGLHLFTGLPTHPLGRPFLFFRDFLFFLRTFHVRCSRTHPPFWERTASAFVIHNIYVLCLPAPHPFSYCISTPSCVFLFSLLMCTAMCYLFGGLLVRCYFLFSSRTIGFSLTSLPAASKTWRN